MPQPEQTAPAIRIALDRRHHKMLNEIAREAKLPLDELAASILGMVLDDDAEAHAKEDA